MEDKGQGLIHVAGVAGEAGEGMGQNDIQRDHG